MERRKFLIGAGSAAVGSSALIGSGAFTSVEAERSVTVDVANDATAFLALEANDTPNGNEYVSTDADGTLTLDFSQTSEGGEGLNRDADTIIRDLFSIENQGTQEVIVGITNIPDGMSFYDDSQGPRDPDSDAESTTLNQDTQGEGSMNLPAIGPGESLDEVGVIFRGSNRDLSNLDDFSGSVTINAYTEDEV